MSRLDKHGFWGKKLNKVYIKKKLIRERTDHKFNALFRYEKASEEQTLGVSRILGLLTRFEVENSAQDEIVCSKSIARTSTRLQMC